MNVKKISSALALSFLVASVPAMAMKTGGNVKSNGKRNGHAKHSHKGRSAEQREQLRQLDTNKDGVISRSEWRGDAAKFDRLDTNHDGVLSQTDRASRDGQSRYRGMDRNNDGVVTRAEWRGNDTSFRQHDRNGDGVLSADEVRAGKKQR